MDQCFIIRKFVKQRVTYNRWVVILVSFSFCEWISAKTEKKFYYLKIFFLFVALCDKWVLLWKTIMGWCLTLRRIINILNIVWPKETLLHLTDVASITFSLIHRKTFFWCCIFFLHGNNEGWRIDQLKHWTIFGNLLSVMFFIMKVHFVLKRQKEIVSLCICMFIMEKWY